MNGPRPSLGCTGLVLASIISVVLWIVAVLFLWWGFSYAFPGG